MHDEDFDDGFNRSAMRELLAPAVADRGLTSAPTDAIVAAGRRRVVGRRTAVAGGALAIVAAVPLAASAIAAGPGAAGTMSAATPAPVPTPAKGLPGPTVVASGTVEGRRWTATVEAVSGADTSTAKQMPVEVVLTVDGNRSTTSPAQFTYGVPFPEHAESDVWSVECPLKDIVTNGAGIVGMGLVSSDVAKIVAHVDGLDPITATIVPAPGVVGEALYFVSIPKDTSFRASFDEYDAHGVKIGSFDTTPANPAKK